MGKEKEVEWKERYNAFTQRGREVGMKGEMEKKDE